MVENLQGKENDTFQTYFPRLCRPPVVLVGNAYPVSSTYPLSPRLKKKKKKKKLIFND